MKKLLLAAVLGVAAFVAPAHASILAGCTTNAWDGFVNVRTLPDGAIVWQLPNGVPVNVFDTYGYGDEWAFVSTAAGPPAAGWSLRSSLVCNGPIR